MWRHFSAWRMHVPSLHVPRRATRRIFVESRRLIGFPSLNFRSKKFSAQLGSNCCFFKQGREIIESIATNRGANQFATFESVMEKLASLVLLGSKFPRTRYYEETTTVEESRNFSCTNFLFIPREESIVTHWFFLARIFSTKDSFQVEFRVHAFRPRKASSSNKDEWREKDEKDIGRIYVTLRFKKRINNSSRFNILISHLISTWRTICFVKAISLRMEVLSRNVRFS